jgi:hypothetical protein
MIINNTYKMKTRQIKCPKDPKYRYTAKKNNYRVTTDTVLKVVALAPSLPESLCGTLKQGFIDWKIWRGEFSQIYLEGNRK